MNAALRSLALVSVTMLVAACGGGTSATPTPPVPKMSPLTQEALTSVVIPAISGKTASMDIFAVDQAAHRLYIADRLTKGVDVIDISQPAGTFLKTIVVGQGTNGLVLAPDLKKLYTGNNDSTISVIDLDPSSPKVDSVIATIPTGGKSRTDEGDYDPQHKKVYYANGDEGFITVIDATTYSVVTKISDLGTLEQPRYNPVDGMMYVAGADENVIIKIDPSTDKMVQKYPVGVPCQPHGIAINPKTDKGLIGCGDTSYLETVSWDFKTEKLIRVFDQAGAGDMVAYDAKVNRFFFAASNFATPGMAIFSGSPIDFLTLVPTSTGAHAVAYDEDHDLIYTMDGKPHEAAVWSLPDPH